MFTQCINALKQSKVFQVLSSLRIAVACLGFLFILTFWGTLAQVEHGLYSAQERYFYSFIFFIFDFFPFPGARLVLFVLFVNLLCAAFVHFKYGWRRLGIIIIHFGLLSFFVAAFVTFHWSEESQVTLMEGETSNVSSSYHQWELSVWPEEEKQKKVAAFDSKNFTSGQTLDFNELGFELIVKAYYPNAQAYTSTGSPRHDIVVNRSNISVLKPLATNKEPEKNFPGAVFLLQESQGQEVNILLFGGESQPTRLEIDGQVYNFQLRRKRYVLPFNLKLLDFIMEVYPNTEIAKSYESKVEVRKNDSSRDVLIYMNHPLRYKNFTLYQASYAIDAMGRELSTFAVVRNSGRLLPYIASFTTVIGLIIHFLMMAFTERRKP